jgi:phage terminase small subunit
LNAHLQLAQLLYYFVRQITWSPTVKTFDKNPFIKMVNQMRNILTAIKRKVGHTNLARHKQVD